MLTRFCLRRTAVNSKLVDRVYYESGPVRRSSERHPLASDVIRSLVGLFPRRHYGMHLWRHLDEPERTTALVATAELEGQYLDRETVDCLAALASQLPTTSPYIFERLWETRGSIAHPLNSDFLTRVLLPMSCFGTGSSLVRVGTKAFSRDSC